MKVGQTPGTQQLAERPSVGGAGSSTAMVDQIIAAQRIPIERLESKRSALDGVKQEFASLASMADSLRQSADAISLPSGFSKFRVESSHPDILDAAITGAVEPGTFELEVGSIAKPARELTAGFPDADATPIGLGHLRVANSDGSSLDVTVPPGSTLNDVAKVINDAGSDVRARVIDTGFDTERFKLLVESKVTGKASAIEIDPDTTFLEFDAATRASDLKLRLDDVDVSRAANEVKDLVPGLALAAKRAEPGTKVSVSVQTDVDGTMEGIQDLVGKYNQLNSFLNQQFVVDQPSDRGAGKSDGGLRSVARQIQTQISRNVSSQGASENGLSLAQIGITTNAKTGDLQVDEGKVKAALAADHESVAALFTGVGGAQAPGGGIAERLSRAVRAIQDPVSGPVKLRQNSLQKAIASQDKEIERRSMLAEQRAQTLRDSFAAMDGRLQQLRSQEQVLQSRFGGSTSQPS